MARKLSSTVPDRSAESRSWARSPHASEAVALASSGLTPAERLDQARDVFAILAKAQKGLDCNSRRNSVTLSFEGAPGVEAAVLEAAERFTAEGGLILQRGPTWIRLHGPREDEIDDPAPFGPQIGASAD